jgi:hypothetical protein
MKNLALLGALLSAACSGALSTRPASSDSGASAVHNDSRVNGALRLELTDYPTNAGIMFALPSVTGGDGQIVVENTRYGSLCLFAVDGRAETIDHTIALHISFEQRLSVCTQEIRALKYSARITEPAGVYDELVIHEENAAADTLVRRTVTVR